MQQAPHREHNKPELEAYRLASWRFAPGAWATAEAILAKWNEQSSGNLSRRVLITTGCRAEHNHVFARGQRS